MMPKTLIIAEIGVNHNANLALAYRMIDAAAASGADAVKFQTAIPDLVATTYAEKAKYQKDLTAADESQLDMIRSVMFPIDTFGELKRYCDRKPVLFFSTAFDPISLAYLEKISQQYHKIPSGEITNIPFIRQIGSYKKPTLLSTGMATLGEIETAILTLEHEGLSRDLISVLQCNTEYPTPFADVNLRAMLSIKEAFGVEVGYSDHTIGIEVPIAAVALGAKIIEKHFTLDRNLPGPDQKASLEPDAFSEMVSAIRNIELALGDGRKRPSISERRNMVIARRSIVAACDIRLGEQFSVKNLCSKRPGVGISPSRWDEVIGRCASRDFKENELIEL